MIGLLILSIEVREVTVTMMTIMIMEVMGAHKGKEFTKELGRLGRQMMKNRFVFQTLLREVGTKDLKMKLSLRGENILPFEKKVHLMH